MMIDKLEGFEMILDTLTVAKELHDIDRYDIVQTQFFDTLCLDAFYENMLGVIASVFTGFHNDYEDDEEYEIMIFTDDVISKYYCLAWEYGWSHNVSHNENPYVIEAKREANRWLGYCFSIGYKLLGYTRTKKTAMQSKLVVYSAPCECCSFDSLAYSLLQLYQFFARKCEEHRERVTKVRDAALENPAITDAREGVMAA